MYNSDHKYCVYKHTSPSGKVYIGITGQPLNKRWRYGDGYSGNPHFANAIKKYKWKNFKHEVLFSGLPLNDAKQKEIELIAFYDSTNRDKGYNRSPGGDLHDPEMSQKIKETRKVTGVTKRESERMKALWANPDYRAEMIAKMRSAPPRTDEQRKRYSAASKGRKLSEAHKKKISAIASTLTGEKSRRGKAVCQIDRVDGHLIKVYPTARIASAEVGKGANHISRVCRGDAPYSEHFSCGSYWCYEGDYREFVGDIELNPEMTKRGLIRRKPKGHHISESHKEAVAAAHRKQVKCLETGIVYKSIRDAAARNGFSGSEATVSRQIRGRQKTAGGYTWAYV